MAELAMDVMCLACKSARTPQMFEVRTDVFVMPSQCRASQKELLRNALKSADPRVDLVKDNKSSWF